jgi:putative spermidine/putrescine transport system permease protein
LGWVLLLAPSVTAVLVCFVVPLALMVSAGFDRFVPPSTVVPAFTLGNFWRFFGDPFYRAIFAQTVGMGLAVVVFCALLSYPLAYALARGRSRWRGLLVIVILSPLMISVVVRSYGWTILLMQGGPLDAAATALGMPAPHLLFTMTGTIIALAEVLLPFMIFTLSSVLQHVDAGLEESAQSLGASRWLVFRDIVLPLSLPGLAAGALLVFVLAISAFATPVLVGGATTQVMASEIFGEATNALNWPFASAMSTFLILFILLLVAAQAWLMRRARQWAPVR